MGEFAKYLRPGESVSRSAGVSGKSLVAQGASLLLVVLGYGIAMQVLLKLGSDSPMAAGFEPIARLIYGALTALLALVAAYVVLILVLRATFTRYGLTDSRVLKRSFLRIRGADLSHVQDVEVVQGILGKLLGFGDVLVRTASTEGVITLRRVDRPQEWFREIHEAVRHSQMASQV